MRAKAALVKAPVGLGKRGGAVFRRYAAALGDRLQAEDASLLADLVVAEMLALESARILFDAPEILERDEAHENEYRKHPAFTQWRMAVETKLKIAKEFGMTPGSRSRMKSPPVDDAIDVATLLYQDDASS